MPAVAGKPVHVAFDGGRMTSDAGMTWLLSGVERRLGIAERLAACASTTRGIRTGYCTGLPEMIRYRAMLIAAGYPTATTAMRCAATRPSRWRPNGCRKAAEDLCSQPSISRLENLPGPVALKRMMAAMARSVRRPHPFASIKRLIAIRNASARLGRVRTPAPARHRRQPERRAGGNAQPEESV